MTEKELQELVVSTDKSAATLTSGVRLVRTAPYKDPREDPRVVEIFFCAAWRPDGKGNVTYGAMYTIWTRENGGSNGIPERLRAQDGEIILLYHTLDLDRRNPRRRIQRSRPPHSVRKGRPPVGVTRSKDP